MAASGLELVPITSQKHDPAWKHCQMFRSGDKVQLKCVYCGKFFRGGGIHRIKEHLAGHKGNAATCLSVPADVRVMMQESLDGIVVRRRKKQRLGDEIANVNNNDNNNSIATVYLDPSGNQYDDAVVNDGMALTVVSGDSAEASPSLLVNREETPGSVTMVKRKRGRPKMSLAIVSPKAYANQPSASNNDSSVKRVNDDQVYIAIARFLYDIGAPFDAVNSVYFKPMVEAIASNGSIVAAPSYIDLRGSVLKTLVEEVKTDIEKVMAGWARTGCSILINELNTEKGQIFLSLMVSSPEGTVFMKFVDATSTINSPDDLYELLKQAVEEVGVSHVVQVIINGVEDRYIEASNRLMETFPNLYWLSCSARCLDLILEDFGKLLWINEIIVKAKSMTRFVYNHSVVLNMMRRYTFGNDIVEIGITRNATDFTTLKRIVCHKRQLQAMVTSQEWVDSPYSRQAAGEEMMDTISDESFWTSCDLIIKLTTSLLRVLRTVSSKKAPSMGYVFAGMYRVKETIKKELVNRDEYMVYWNIIDNRWKQQRDSPLQAAGFYLNPKFFYSLNGEIQNQIQSRIFDCIERLVPDTSVQDKITKELTYYKNASGDFGRKMAVRARDTLPPAEWWSTYGGSCPNLARFAIHILGQTCSSSRLIHDCQVTLEKVNEMKNCLEQQRLRDLIFVQYNLRLRQMGCERKEQDIMDQFSLHGVNKSAEDWISGKDGDYETSHWMQLDQFSSPPMPLGSSSNDEVDELVGGFDDHEILNGMRPMTDKEVKVEDENVEIQ